MDNLTPDTTLALLKASESENTERLEKLKNKAKDNNSKLDEVAKEFEAVFVTEMMKPMFENIKPDARFGGGKGEEVFRGMMLQEYGKLIAQTGQVGIAEAVKEELIRMQEKEGGNNEATSATE